MSRNSRAFTVHFDVSFTVDGDSGLDAEEIAFRKLKYWASGASDATEPDCIELVDTVGDGGDDE